MMPVEYAISAGEGTLIDYGVADGVESEARGVLVYDLGDISRARQSVLYPSELSQFTAISAYCPDDCATGK